MTLPLNSPPYKYLFRFISILIISGFAAQYFFLAAFTLMCAMSCEVWLQLRYGKNQFKKVIQMLFFSFFVFSEVMQPMKSVTVLKFGFAMYFRSYFLSLLVLWKPSDLDAHQWHPNLQRRVASFHVCTFHDVINYLILFTFSDRNFKDESRLFVKQSILIFKWRPFHWIGQRLNTND